MGASVLLETGVFSTRFFHRLETRVAPLHRAKKRSYACRAADSLRPSLPHGQARGAPTRRGPNATARATFSVPSNTGSPVVFTKSASTIVSCSVNARVALGRNEGTRPARRATSAAIAAAASHGAICRRQLWAGETDEKLASISAADARRFSGSGDRACRMMRSNRGSTPATSVEGRGGLSSWIFVEHPSTRVGARKHGAFDSSCLLPLAQSTPFDSPSPRQHRPSTRLFCSWVAGFRARCRVRGRRRYQGHRCAQRKAASRR